MGCGASAPNSASDANGLLPPQLNGAADGTGAEPAPAADASPPPPTAAPPPIPPASEPSATVQLPPPPPEEEAEAAAEPCPTDGVALWALRHFLAQHAARAAGKSTGAVCLEIVKPATRALRCAYVELLRGELSPDVRRVPAVAPATVFISHAWGNSFESLVAAVEAHLGAEGEDAFVWLDILTVRGPPPRESQTSATPLHHQAPHTHTLLQ